MSTRTILVTGATGKQGGALINELEWFDRVGYNADIDGTAREFGVTPTRLEEWAKAQGAVATT